MRRATLLGLLGCGGQGAEKSPEPEVIDSAAPDTADSGGGPADSAEDTADSAPPTDTVDTAPPGDTVDSGDTAPFEPSVDCEKLPPLPVAYTMMPGFTTAEDFTFGADGNYLAFDGNNLVSIDSAAVKTVLVPMGGGITFIAAGVGLLADGDVVVNNYGSYTVMRVGLDGTQTTLLTGVGYPNGLTVSVDNLVYVSAHDSGKIYELNPDTGDFSVIATGLSYANGLAFSPDGQTLYVCAFYLGIVWAVERDGKGGWKAPWILHDMVSSLDGLNVDECGNVYVTDYDDGKIYRIDPDDPSVAHVVADVPPFWIPNLHWGRGIAGFDDRTLYVANRDTGALIALEVGVGSTPQAFVVP